MIRVYDEQKITEIVMSMFDDVVEDNTDKSCFELDVNADCWIAQGDYEALFQVVPFNRTTLDLHCYIPKGNRNKSKEYALSAINWIKENAPSMYRKIITQTPFRHIKIFVLSLGFEKEGSYKKAFTKNGKLHDLDIFGMAR